MTLRIVKLQLLFLILVPKLSLNQDLGSVEFVKSKIKLNEVSLFISGDYPYCDSCKLTLSDRITGKDYSQYYQIAGYTIDSYIRVEANTISNATVNYIINYLNTEDSLLLEAVTIRTKTLPSSEARLRQFNSNFYLKSESLSPRSAKAVPAAEE